MREYQISVVVPVYNGENTIKACIESIDHTNAEVIIVDDGSKDSTYSICKEYEKVNSNIRALHKENQGVALARKYGVEHASGKYIMFIDADDCYTPNTITRVLEVIKKYDNPDLIRFRYQKIPNGYDQYKYFPEQELFIKKEEFKEKVYPMFLDGYMLNAVWSNCVKRDLLTRIYGLSDKINVGYGEDLLLNLDIFSSIDNAVFIEDILYKYIYREGSITNTKSPEKLLKNLEDGIRVYSKLYEYLYKWDMFDQEYIKIVKEKINKTIDVITEKITEAERLRMEGYLECGRI